MERLGEEMVDKAVEVSGSAAPAVALNTYCSIMGRHLIELSKYAIHLLLGRAPTLQPRC